jgi:hypothetical protein
MRDAFDTTLSLTCDSSVDWFPNNADFHNIADAGVLDKPCHLPVAVPLVVAPITPTDEGCTRYNLVIY